ncbi:hypothetical protein BKA62DRAFT_712198, partial [Auriculariales sp. MPI-PUGE-AT-0066]
SAELRSFVALPASRISPLANSTMRFSLAPVLALISLAAAAAVPTNGGSNNQCQGGDTYCCNSNPSTNNPTGGLVAVPLNVILGLQCSPLNVLAILLGTTW